MRQRDRSTTGFSLLEILVVVSILAVVIAYGYPVLAKFLVRSKLEGSARQITTLMHRARMDAIQRGVPAVVHIDTAQQTFTGFTNVDDDVALVFAPDPDRDWRDTDYELGSLELPGVVTFDTPAGSVVDAFTNVPWNATNVAVFEPDGSVRALGAFRLADAKNNYLEVRVEPRATARISLRKWDGTAWRSQGENGQSWEWN